MLIYYELIFIKQLFINNEYFLLRIYALKFIFNNLVFNIYVQTNSNAITQ